MRRESGAPHNAGEGPGMDMWLSEVLVAGGQTSQFCLSEMCPSTGSILTGTHPCDSVGTDAISVK